MSAPDFYFAVNAMAGYIHDRFGKAALVEYWRGIGREYYARRTRIWKERGPQAVADDWREYFAKEPNAVVDVSVTDGTTVDLDVKVCPAIKHLRESGREIVPYFCEHCDQVCGAMAESSGYTFERTGGMGSCHQRFVQITTGGGKR